MSDDSTRRKMGGIGGAIVETIEKNMRDKLRSHGISTVEVGIVPKLEGPCAEFSGPEEDVKKAKKCLGYVRMKDYLRQGRSYG